MNFIKAFKWNKQNKTLSPLSISQNHFYKMQNISQAEITLQSGWNVSSPTTLSCQLIISSNWYQFTHPTGREGWVGLTGLDPGVGGLDPLKICRRGQSMFWPPKMLHSFIQNCCWIILQVSPRMKDLCQKWKAELIFRGAWNSLTAWPDWPWPSYFRQYGMV